MGRLTSDGGGRFRNLGAAAAALLLAGGLLALVTARAAKPEHGEPQAKPVEQGDSHEPAGQAEGKEEEKDALEHVMDSKDLELFESFGPRHVRLWFWDYELFGQKYYFPTKFMWLELIAAILIVLAYIPLAVRLRSGDLPTGWRTNFHEVLLTFVRDDIARPAIGEHDADKYVPFLWTIFLFILVNNILGLVPFFGSATSNIYVTAALAICVFFAIHGSGAVKMGLGHYLTSLWPHFDVPYGLGYVIKPLIFALEWLGVLVRNGVLAVRLFANMFAGHVVLATLLIFIFAAGTGLTGALDYALWGTVTVSSVLGQVALSLLELFVACLQAYIFTFLAALFMGMAMHPAH
jgi:F-type H+-transporting ATPase subunit a